MKNIVKKVALLGALGAVAAVMPGTATGTSTTPPPSTAPVAEGSCPTTVTSGKIDLCIASFTIDPPSPVVGSPVCATIKIKNWGTAAFDSTKYPGLLVQWRPDTLNDKATIYSLALPSIPGVKADGTVNAGQIMTGEKFCHTFKALPSPNNPVSSDAWVDPTGTLNQGSSGSATSVVEPNTTNNVLTKSKSVTVLAAPSSKLKIASFVVNPSTNTYNGKSIRQNNVYATIKVQNTGTAIAKGVVVKWNPDVNANTPTVKTASAVDVPAATSDGKPGEKIVELDKNTYWQYPEAKSYTSQATVTEGGNTIYSPKVTVDVQPHVMSLRFTFGSIYVLNSSDGSLDAKGQCRFWFYGKIMTADGKTKTLTGNPTATTYLPSQSTYGECKGSDSGVRWTSEGYSKILQVDNVLETDIAGVYYDGKEDDSGGTNGADDDKMGTISLEISPYAALKDGQVNGSFVQKVTSKESQTGTEGGKYKASWTVDILNFK